MASRLPHRSSRRRSTHRHRRRRLGAAPRRSAGHADRRERREQLAGLGAAGRAGDLAGGIGERDELLEEVVQSGQRYSYTGMREPSNRRSAPNCTGLVAVRPLLTR